MKWIKDCTLDEIGEVLTKVCMLADVEPPAYPKLVAEFIKSNYAVHELSVIAQSFDYWILGQVDVKRPMTLNAQFVSTVITKVLKDGLIRNLNVYRPPRKEIEPPKLTPEEEKYGYELLYKDWCRYENSNNLDIALMFLQVKYEYIYRNIDKMLYSDANRLDMIQELKGAYIENKKRQKLIDLKNGIRSRFNEINESTLPNLNWNRVACVAMHMRDRFKKNIQNNE